MLHETNMHCFVLAAIFGLLPCVAVTISQKTPSLDDLEDALCGDRWQL